MTTDVLDKQPDCHEQGDGDAVVFLHGNPTSSHRWRSTTPNLARAGWMQR